MPASRMRCACSGSAMLTRIVRQPFQWETWFSLISPMYLSLTVGDFPILGAIILKLDDPS